MNKKKEKYFNTNYINKVNFNKIKVNEMKEIVNINNVSDNSKIKKVCNTLDIIKNLK